MNWASQRKVTIIIVIVAVLLALLAVTLIATFHHTPSCTDNIQNQGEQGVDCGGPCPYLCRASEQAPVTLFTRAVISEPNRTDVIAMVQNENVYAAAKNVPFQVTLYGDNGSVLKTLSGTLDLPPAVKTGGKVPVFIPGALLTGQHVANASLTIDPAKVWWYALATDPRILPNSGNFLLTNASSSPRLSASLTNSSVTPLTNVKTIAIVYDSVGNVMAASQTILPMLSASDTQTITFTWNAPFSLSAGSIDIIPVIALP